MKHPIDGLEAFIQIAELGSFNKAAEKLHVTQTALTRRMQRLEAYLGLKLLDRTTRVVVLSTVGRAFLPEAKRLVDELERSIERLRSQSRDASGDVAIASIPSLMFGQLPSVLREYTLRSPANRIRILDRSSAQVMESVQRRQAEFGLHIQMAGQPDLQTELLRREPFVAYCRNDHSFADRDSIQWSELLSTDLITLGGGSGNRLLMEEQLLHAGIDARTKFVVEYFSSAIGLVQAGLGVAILVATEGPRLRKDIIQIPLVEPVIERPLFLIRRRGETLTPAAQQLFNLIQQRYSQAFEPS